MSTERYEIKGKIGQGGVGAVYHAYDTQLNRDVAIKRVLAEGGYENQDDATKHLLKEATALSAVQHPHIVTVYDAGIDDDGPYVVMELIHGRTLDEMVERGTLTWDDIKEVALQSQEALIAAQDLNLVHRDLKPSNVMVCWLPSGKFQVKIVDFGLAKFSAAPSLQTIDHGDAVFGSIFFMAPEQFERTPLDQRTDMYALGCLYYYALTGEHPFTGDTAAEVMASHLQHHVTHLREARPDIPEWGADWIMWHLERNMDDRPENARAALKKFLIHDKQSTQPVSVSSMTTPDTPSPDSAPKPSTPKLIFPGSEPTEPETPPAADTPPAAAPAPVNPPAEEAAAPAPVKQTAPQPIAPPDGGALSPHTEAQKVVTSTAAQQAAAEPAPATPPAPSTPPAPATPPAPGLITPAAQAAAQAPAEPETPAAPAPISLATPTTPTTPAPPAATPAPPAAQAPATTPQISLTGGAAPAAPAATPPAPAAPEAAVAATGPATVASAKKSMPMGAKIAMIGLLALVIGVAIWVMTSISGSNKQIELTNKALERAKELNDKGTLHEGIDLTQEELEGILARATSMEDDKQRPILLKTLAYANTSGANETILTHITEAKTPENIRAEFFKTVMTRRKNIANVAPLLKFAKETNEDSSAAEAIHAARMSAAGQDADEFIDDFIGLINDTDSAGVRGAAERAAGDLISESENKADFATPLYGSYQSAVNDGAKYALLRLLGTTGGEKATEAVKAALKDKNPALQTAAIASLGNWVDDSQFDALVEFIEDTDNEKLRIKAFDAAYNFLRKDRKRDPEDLGDLWKSFAGSAKTQREKLKIISGMANQKHEWAIPVLEYFTEDKDDRVIDKAERAKERLEQRIRENEGGGDEDDE